MTGLGDELCDWCIKECTTLLKDSNTQTKEATSSEETEDEETKHKLDNFRASKQEDLHYLNLLFKKAAIKPHFHLLEQQDKQEP